MQTLDEAKRKKIVATATKLFSRKDYHSVCLSDIAAKAGVGKGTLYVYFKSKEDLFISVRVEGYMKMYRYLQKNIDIDSGEPLANLYKIIYETVSYSYSNPAVFQILRNNTTARMNPQINQTRKQVIALTTSVIEKGVAAGVLSDARPSYTANYLLDVVRSGLSQSEGRLAKDELIDHIYTFFSKALAVSR